MALAGDPTATAEAHARLVAAGFDVHDVPSEQAARDAIMEREVYGAILLHDPPRVLIASAASAAVAQALPAAAAQTLGLEAVPTVDVRPGPAKDPRGLGFAASILPLIITSVVAAALLGSSLPALAWRVTGAVVFAVVGGMTATSVIQGWFGSLEGDYLANSAAMTTILAAITLSLVGLQAVAGRTGIALGAAIMMLVGSPLSGATSSPELLPEPWGAIGQLLPPGAGASVIRSVAFFNGAGSGMAWAVLTGWIAVGAALIGLAALRKPASEGARVGLAEAS